MKNLKQSLKKPLKGLPISAAITILVIALVGFADASYLTLEHFRGVTPPCTLTTGCDTVLNSPFSVFFGIPVSLLGALFYLTVMIGAFSYIESRNETMIRFALWFTIFGFLASVWFVALQIFIIHSYCMYCLISAITSTTLFVVSMEFIKKYHETY
ncbi:MAG: vitamin K epoxide reductase family protein [Patescibacteria group bacterium]|nr:vitamin K epoxide reductase family protein [Patescibacteria group bacterium]